MIKVFFLLRIMNIEDQKFLGYPMKLNLFESLFYRVVYIRKELDYQLCFIFTISRKFYFPFINLLFSLGFLIY
jgi:hypothetical protein